MIFILIILACDWRFKPSPKIWIRKDKSWKKKQEKNCDGTKFITLETFHHGLLSFFYTLFHYSILLPLLLFGIVCLYVCLHVYLWRLYRIDVGNNKYWYFCGLCQMCVRAQIRGQIGTGFDFYLSVIYVKIILNN